jgi:hypothetical protein
VAQIKSITCDNASNNDTMVDGLKDLLEIFPGESNRTRCFDHIVNLIAKSVIQQFDIPKTKGNASFDDVLRELVVTAEDLEEEELATREGEQSDDEGDDDNTDGVNEPEEMSEEEQRELDDSIQPVRRVLIKVSASRRKRGFGCVDNVTRHAPSSARLHIPSKTLQLLSSLAGMWCLMNLS